MGTFSDGADGLARILDQSRDRKWQRELQDRQRQQWAEEDRVKAGQKAAAERFGSRLTELMGSQQGDTQGTPSADDDVAPTPIDQPASLNAPAGTGQGLSLAGSFAPAPAPASAQAAAAPTPDAAPGAGPGLSAATPSAGPAEPADVPSSRAGLASAQFAGAAQPDAAAQPQPTGEGMSMSMGMGGNGLASAKSSVPKLAAPKKVSELEAIYDAAGERGKVLAEHGLADQYMDNWAKRAQLGVKLREDAAQQADAAYAQTQDPTEYIKRMAPYMDTGIDLTGTEKVVGADGKPAYKISYRNTTTGQDGSYEATGDQLLEQARKMRDPKEAMQLEFKSQLAKVQAGFKMEEDDHSTKNKKGLQDNKAEDDANLEKLKQQGRLGLNAAEVAGRIKTDAAKASGDGAIRPKDQIAAIDSDRKGITSRLQDLHKEVETELKDPNLDDNQRASIKQSYERQVSDLTQQGKVLDQRRAILYKNLNLDGGGTLGNGPGLSSAKGATPAPAKVSGPKNISALRSDAASAIAKGKDPKAVAARFQQMTGQAY